MYLLTDVLTSSVDRINRITDDRVTLHIAGLLTAGKAKNEMPMMAHDAAISFPIQVFGTASP